MRFLTRILLKLAEVIIGIVQFIIEVFRRINDRFVRVSKGIQAKLGSRFSAKRKNQVSMMVVYAGLTRNPEEILGIVLMYSIMLSAAFTFLVLAVDLSEMLSLSQGIISLLAAVVPFIATWIIFYLIFVFLIDRRTSSVEKVLPDVLTLISQNMIAGMTVYNSLWVAARPEFGPLAAELQSVARETLGGESFERALMNMSRRIDSYKLSRSVKLIIQGMHSGGELPTVLQEIATDIRQEQALYKKMSSQITAQVMFILFALLGGAPLLFAASYQFVTIFNQIYDKLNLDNQGGSELAGMSAQAGVMMLEKIPISAGFFGMYAILTLGILGIFGGALIGLIRTGKLSSGLPFMPIIPIASILIYLGLVKFLSGIFGSMLTV